MFFNIILENAETYICIAPIVIGIILEECTPLTTQNCFRDFNNPKYLIECNAFGKCFKSLGLGSYWSPNEYLGSVRMCLWSPASEF